MRLTLSSARLTVTLVLSTIFLGACLEKEVESVAIAAPPPAVNTPPSISGAPATQVDMGVTYSFQPTANDTDGDSLAFSISNGPGWATLDRSSGLLSGTPLLGDVRTFNNIVISVSDGSDSVSLPAFSITVRDPNSNNNSAPTISGTPSASVVVGNTYSFQPSASDADGDTLQFSIQNQPGWAAFNSNTGLLSGTPQAGTEGNYAGIVISVSDGSESASLPGFAIDVNQIATGSATLNWTAPTQYEDNSSLGNGLAGFRIYYGTAPNTYTQTIQIDNPGMTTYVVENLSASTYYFATSAFSTDGLESEKSNEAVKTIN